MLWKTFIAWVVCSMYDPSQLQPPERLITVLGTDHASDRDWMRSSRIRYRLIAYLRSDRIVSQWLTSYQKSCTVRVAWHKCDEKIYELVIHKSHVLDNINPTYCKEKRYPRIRNEAKIRVYNCMHFIIVFVSSFTLCFTFLPWMLISFIITQYS